MASLDDRLAALATMSPAQIRAEWGRLMRVPCPAIPLDLLTRAIAYRCQEKQRGGLPSSAAREIGRMARQLERGDVTVARGDATPKPGTRLVRDWRGRRHQVTVLDQGFLYQDRHYRSLTQIARDITGAGWSGPRFFGLVRRSDAKAVRP
ncbi:DUF2924 domain-containing protein [Sphingomonas nostoxanthinifaciens]|nr:DUF2924 domain-containing protein [Sphingomonas nostoxanthinifaciens]